MAERTFQQFQDSVALAAGYPDSTKMQSTYLSEMQGSIRDAARDIANRAPWSFLVASASATIGAVSQYVTLGGTDSVLTGQYVHPTHGTFYCGVNSAGSTATQKPLQYLQPEAFRSWRARQGTATTATAPEFYTYQFRPHDLTPSASRGYQGELLFQPTLAQGSNTLEFFYHVAPSAMQVTGENPQIHPFLDFLLFHGSIRYTLERLSDPESKVPSGLARTIYEDSVQRMSRTMMVVYDKGNYGDTRKSHSHWAWRMAESEQGGES